MNTICWFKFLSQLNNLKDFGHIVKDRSKELKEFAKRLKKIQEDTSSSNIRDLLIAFNNHFAGFGPQSVNDFLKIMNMSEVDWKKELEKQDQSNSRQFTGNYQSNYLILVEI
jgi:hypothetical protein